MNLSLELDLNIKHIPVQIDFAGKELSFIAETRKGEITGLFYATYEQGKAKHYECSFMLDEVKEEVERILESEECAR